MSTTYAELLAQKAALDRQTAELEKQLTAARKDARTEIVSQIRALMAEHGLTADDLGGKPGKVQRSKDGEKRPVAPKYKDPLSSATWSGRGLKPKWVLAAEASGKSLEDIAI